MNVLSGIRSTPILLSFAILLATPSAVLAKSPPGADLVAITFAMDSGFAVLSRYECFTSSDGSKWRAMGLSKRGELLTSVAAGGRSILVGTNSGKILISYDGGEFAALAEPRDPFGRKAGSIKMLVLGPKGRQIVASSGQGVVRSLDSGKTWKPIKKPFWENPEARQVLAIGFLKKSLVVVTGSGPYLEKGGKFIPFSGGLPGGMRPTAASFGPDRILLGLNGGGLYLAKGTRKWKQLPEVSGQPLAFVGFAGKGYIAAGAFSTVNISDPRGRKWDTISGISSGFVPLSSATSPKGTYFALRGRGLVRLKGVEFEPVELPVSLSSVLAEAELGTRRLAGTQGGVFMSRDGGLMWEDVTPAGLGKPVNAFLKLADGRILLASEGLGVFASEDEGDTWEDWSLGLGTANTVRSLVAAGGRILASTENGIMETGTGKKPLWKPLDSRIPRAPVGSIVKVGGMFWVGSARGVFSAGKDLDFKPVKGLGGRTGELSAEGQKVAAIISRKVVLKDIGGKITTLPPFPAMALPSTVLIYGGVLFAGTNAGTFRWTGGIWEAVDSSPFPVSKLAASDKGIRVVTSGAGTYYLKNKMHGSSEQTYGTQD